MFTEKIFEAVNAIEPSARNELEITDAIQYLLDKGYNIESEIIKGWWKDTGKLDDLLEANRMVLSSMESEIEGEVDTESSISAKVTIRKGARITRSTIKGPAIIGENCVIIDSYVGPYSSIEQRVELRSCEVENSIIMEGTKVSDITGRISESLIGKDVEITKSNGSQSTHMLMVGDSSRLEFP